ncbi:hypothetical protein SK128_027626 [Halocaridina rubra]|uniref:Nephrin/kirre n=1 Tax=Halocaridina rubra TaxID=373956 RepID=A0AAN8WL08_HALRR
MGTIGSLSEGERYEIVCESSGSRPTATITWWKDGMLMTDTKNQVFQEGNVSRSTLYLTPSLADNDAYVSCRAKNPMVPAAVLEDSRKLTVHYTPRLSLAAGHNLDMEDIKEGDDVYFECGIKANPKVYKVQWFHNGEELIHNVTLGVIQSNQSLVLQRVSRRSSGQYTCSATNTHGLGKSNAVQLSVKFAPICRSGQKVVYGGGKHEEINITCSVEAHPEPTNFRWAFNSSSEVVDIPSSRFWVIGKGRSQASYIPRTHMDYGNLLCWANNEVGRQQKPCIFHVIHASAPDPVHNCTVENVTSTGAAIQCQAGWDGGMDQTFTLMYAHARSHTRPHDTKVAPRVLANTSTSPKPEFVLTGLEPGTEYVLTVTGINKRGQSDVVRMAIITPKDVAEKRTSPGTDALDPIYAVLLGVLGSVLFMVVLIVVIIKCRRPMAPKQEIKMHCDKREHQDSGTGDDHNPDVIMISDFCSSLSTFSDHEVREFQKRYPSEVFEGSSAISDHLQQKASVHGSSPKQPTNKDYLQGHDGSFCKKSGTLLHQNIVIPPRETDPLPLMGCPLAASKPTPHGAAFIVNTTVLTSLLENHFLLPILFHLLPPLTMYQLTFYLNVPQGTVIWPYFLQPLVIQLEQS